MLWTVTYKDKDGRQDKIEMEAENRAIVIGNMRKRGCTVVNIMDGGLRANSKKQKSRQERLAETSKKSGLLTWLVLLLLLAIGGGVAWWYGNGKPDVLASFRNGSIREVLGGRASPPPPPQKPHTGKALIRIAD